MKQLLVLSIVFACGLCSLPARAGEKAREARPEIMTEVPAQVSQGTASRIPEQPRPEGVIGVPTTLEGYYDYQVNGGAVRHVQADPATGAIHAVYMLSFDSSDVNGTRRTGYAYSSNGGTSWTNFSNVRVPDRRSGFPTVDIGRGPIAGATLVANHADVSGVNKTIVNVDFPAGQGAFSELGTQGNFAAGEPIWPHVVGAHDGSIIVHAAINSTTLTDLNHRQRTADLLSWSTWSTIPQPNGTGGRSSMNATANGRVGMLVWASANGLRLFESTNHGATWPASSTEVYPPRRYVGNDTLGIWVGSDFTYDGETPLVAINTSRASATGFFFAGSRIEFWSQATGFVDAVPWDSTRYPSTMVSQSNHLSLGYPAIAKSGSRIVIAYMAFRNDTTTIDTATGRYHGDIFYVQSSNNGVTWSNPVNVTNTPQLDERYPSISRWNPDGFAYLTWQEDTRAGSHAFSDNSPKSLSRQIFHKLDLTAVSVGEPVAGQPSEFRLEQNYPNPFNPVTRIAYTVAAAAPVKLVVYNALGQQVAVLADGHREAGQYEVEFSSANLPSGVYFYSLTAGNFSAFKKMMVLK